MQADLTGKLESAEQLRAKALGSVVEKAKRVSDKLDRAIQSRQVQEEERATKAAEKLNLANQVVTKKE